MSEDSVGAIAIDPKKKPLLSGYEEFGELMQKHPQGRVAIFSHTCPDPDAMASMMGIQWLLLRAFGLHSDLYYAGEISHPQNGVVLNLLNPNLKRIKDYPADEDYALHILVDTIPANAGVEDHVIDFDVVIDHHRDLPEHFNKVLIHRKSGSCAAIIYDMMKHFVDKHNWLDEDNNSDQKLATALLAGVVTDTEYMMSDDSTSMEFVAFSELFPYRDSALLKEIVFYKRPKLWIDKKAEGCTQALITEDGLAIVGLGIIPDKHRDLISDMADEMMRWNSVTTAIAFSVVGGDRIEGSVRSLNASLTVSDFCKKLGGKHGAGGGKNGKGAYRLPLGGLSIDQAEESDDIEEAWESMKKRETKRIVRALSK